MAVTEQQRHRILAWFEEQMGHDLGATMMELLPPADSSQLATKADLAVLREGLRADLNGGLLGVQRTCGTWLFASQAAVITVLAILIAFVH